MGTGDLYGAGYYNGQKIIGTSVDGYYWLDDGHGGQVKGPKATPETDQAIQNAANAGFSGWEASQQQAAGKANPAYGAFLDAMQQYGVQPGQSIDTAPAPVQQAYQNFRANPIAEPSTAPTGPATYLIGGQTVDANGNPVAGGYNALADLYRQLGTTPGAVNPQVLDLLRQNPNLAQGLPSGSQGTLAATLQNLGITLPTPSGNLIPTNTPTLPSDSLGGMRSIAPPSQARDATPSIPIGPSGTPSGAPGTLPPGTPGTPGTGPVTGDPRVGAGVGLTTTTPENALTNFTIAPNNTVDRVKLAQDALTNTIQNVLDPQFQARERDLNRYNFGAGRGVSGQARTSQGDLASDYGRQVANLSNTLLNNATVGSIEDLYRNIGIAQQQQAFQAGQQGTAFNQNLALQGLADQENNSAFNQALQQIIQGYQGNPANLALILAQIYGSEGQNASNAASNYAASQQQQQNQQQQNQSFQDWFNQWLMNQIPSASSLPIQTTPSGGYQP